VTKEGNVKKKEVEKTGVATKGVKKQFRYATSPVNLNRVGRGLPSQGGTPGANFLLKSRCAGIGEAVISGKNLARRIKKVTRKAPGGNEGPEGEDVIGLPSVG